MGLLDDLLGGLAGQAMGGRAQQQPTPATGGGAGMSQVLVALMPIVLGMLANRGSQGASPTQMSDAPGASGGIADGARASTRRRDQRPGRRGRAW